MGEKAWRRDLNVEATLRNPRRSRQAVYAAQVAQLQGEYQGGAASKQVVQRMGVWAKGAHPAPCRPRAPGALLLQGYF